MLFFDTATLFHAFYCSAPAVWIKVLSFGVCFKSLASFCHPQYLLRTSPRSIPCAWNSRIWHFHLNNALLPPEKCLKSRFCDFEAWIDEIECQFRRFLARTFRPVYLLALLRDVSQCPRALTPVAGLIFETKNRAIFLERFFGREITAREQLSRAVILARF